MNTTHTRSIDCPDFRFGTDGSFLVKEDLRHRTREPWLMLLTRRGQAPVKTLCWGLTNTGSSFARIGTQEADLVNGFVHEDPYKAAPLGQFVFIKTDADFFSAAWYPQCRPEQALETRFGFGFVEYRTQALGISSALTCFLHPEADTMLQLLDLRNDTGRTRKLEIFSVVPVNIGDARAIGFSGFNSLMLGGAYIDRELGATVFRNHFGVDLDQTEPDGEDDTLRGVFSRVLVHASSVNPAGYGTRYEDFVGHHSNGMLRPAALTGACVGVAESASSLPGQESEDACSSLSTLHCVIELAPGQSRSLVFSCHAASARDYYLGGGRELRSKLAECGDPAAVRRLLERERAAWREELSALSCALPGGPVVNHSIEWLRYQCIMVGNLNRMKSRFHSGFEYGFGFRDILQDVLAWLPVRPGAVREILPWIAGQMFSDGSVYHNFFANTKGNRDFVACDDPLWLVYTVCEYVRETADFGLLDEPVPYADEQEGLPPRQGSMLDHLLAGLDRVRANSRGGLPLMLMADWNDDLSDYADHASVLCAMMLHKALLDMAGLLDARAERRAEPPAGGDGGTVSGTGPDTAARLLEEAATLCRAIEAQASQADGSYIRALAGPQAGADLGSTAGDGNIFFEPLAWSGYSGVADAARFKAVKAVCERELYDLVGVRICKADRSLTERRIPGDYAAWKRSAPGKKENGGAFRHLESWYMASLCRFGYAEEAWDLFERTLPFVQCETDPWRYAAEPFVYPEYVSGPDSREHGRAGHTWLTGTAPTRLGVLFDWILGLRRSWSGLDINPCVPRSWTQWTVTRHWRGRVLKIGFVRDPSLAEGEVNIMIDGRRIEGRVLTERDCPPGEYVVEVRLA